MRLNFIKCSPAKNTTVFITNYVDPQFYRKISRAVMSYEYIQAEQVGFIVAPENKNSMLKIEMSGNEFCGNAVLSAAALVYHMGISSEDHFFIESSGVEGPLYCEVWAKPNHVIEVKAEMPKPYKLEKMEIEADGKRIAGCLVHLPGISHFVTDYCLDKPNYDQVMESLSDKTKAKAIGIIPYKKLEKGKYEILPYVYVRDSGSKVFEQACGSGSLSLGTYLGTLGGGKIIQVLQPGGTLTVETGDKSYLTTNVFFTCEGIVDIF